MPELKEIFDMVSEKVEPELDSWNEQEQRQRRAARNRRLGAMTLAASIVIVVVVVALLALGDGSDRTVVVPTPTPTPNTRRDLYVVDPETGDATLLLAAPGNQTDPERSPDGARLVYVSTPPGSSPQIFVLEADGTERQVTALERGAKDPTWSPDGRQIAFSSGSDTDTDIFVMNADGSRIRRLAGTPRHDSHPDWSPDGTQIAFQSGFNRGVVGFDRGDRSEIWLASVLDGTLTRPPLRFPNFGADPAWSPDGRWLAFTVFAGTTLNGEIVGADVWLVKPDGTQGHRLGGRGLFLHLRQNPSWSPDGRSIVSDDNYHRLNVIDVRTGSARTLGPWPVESPSWDTEGILVSKLG